MLPILQFTFLIPVIALCIAIGFIALKIFTRLEFSPSASDKIMTLLVFAFGAALGARLLSVSTAPLVTFSILAGGALQISTSHDRR